MTMTIERRGALIRPSVRAAESGGAKVLTGLAAVFYRDGDPTTEFVLWSNSYEKVVERIMPTAFDAAIASPDDVRALIDHEPSKILGRVPAGTLRLSKTAEGLAYEVDLPDTSAARDLVVSLDRGDITQSSFGFVVSGSRAVRGREEWREIKTVDDKWLIVRELHDVTLFDVSPVTYAAYAGTSSGMRSAGHEPGHEHQRELEARRRQALPGRRDADRLAMARRRLEILAND